VVLVHKQQIQRASENAYGNSLLQPSVDRTAPAVYLSVHRAYFSCSLVNSRSGTQVVFPESSSCIRCQLHNTKQNIPELAIFRKRRILITDGSLLRIEPGDLCMNPLSTFLELQRDGRKAVLCIVAETKGSCPGKAGFKMTVPPQGSCAGSVGGGSMEFRVITLARKMMEQNENKPRIVSFEHTADADPEERSGLICAGNQKIVLVPHVSPSTQVENIKGLVVDETGIRFSGKPPEKTALCVSSDSWLYTEKLSAPPTVYIFGGGHCSLALTPVLNSLNMRVVVVDNREHVWTMAENTQAWKKTVCDYKDVSNLIRSDGEALVVVMTASHTGDATVLSLMLPKKLKYLGMMASKATGKFVMDKMRSQGFSEQELEKVYTPIGIPIGSQTPAEIAISIAAEIVKVLNAD